MPRPTECEEHRVYFAAGDQCPVCEGVELERERIIKVVENLTDINGDHKFFIIQAIKGKKNG